jgi:hypothetical protein
MNLSKTQLANLIFKVDEVIIDTSMSTIVLYFIQRIASIKFMPINIK